MNDPNWLAFKIAALWASLLEVSGLVLLMLTAVVMVPEEQGVGLKAGWVLLGVSVLTGQLFLGRLVSLLAGSDGSRATLYDPEARLWAIGQFLPYVAGATLVLKSTTGAVTG